MDEKNILYLIGGAALYYALKKDSPKIGAIYPTFENDIKSAVINEIGEVEGFLKEADFYSIENQFEKELIQSVKITNSRDAFNLAKTIPKFGEKGGDYLYLFLDKGNRTIAYSIQKNDDIKSVKNAIKHGVKNVISSIIVCKKSNVEILQIGSNDVKLKNDIKVLSQKIDVPFLDYVLVNENDYYSLSDRGIFGHARLSYDTALLKYKGGLKNAKDFAALLRTIIGGKMNLLEVFVTIYLDDKIKPIAYVINSLGGTDAVIVDVKLLLGTALRLNAKHVILSHNHPSARSQPSQADLSITKKIKTAMEAVDISVIDHIIVTKDSYYSFDENGIHGIAAIREDKPLRGGSMCLDGKYSTYGPRHPGGVCSYHGGRYNL